MTTLAVLCVARPFGGNYQIPYLTIWDNNNLLWAHELPDFNWVYDPSNTLTVSSDGRYVCLAAGGGTRIFSVEEGTYESVPEVKNYGSFGPWFRPVAWSPRNAFISGFADYAYFPDAKELIELPGPSEAAKADSNAYTVLAGLGMIFENMPYEEGKNPMDYRVVARDIFSGQGVEPPAGVNGIPYAGMRPAGWHDDTGVQGMIYNTIDFDAELNTRSRVVNSRLHWERILTGPSPYREFHTASIHLRNGCLFRPQTPSVILFETYPGIIISDTGEVTYIDGLNPRSAELRHNSITFEYNNFGFSTSEEHNVQSDPPLAALSLIGADLPGAQPQFMSSLEPWGGFDYINITQIASPTIYRDPFEPEGEFWTKLRYASETRL